MVAPQVDAEESLPVTDTFVILKIRLPAAASIKLRHQPVFSKLAGDGSELFHHMEMGVAQSKHIHAGIVEKLVITQERTARDGLGVNRRSRGRELSGLQG